MCYCALVGREKGPSVLLTLLEGLRIASLTAVLIFRAKWSKAEFIVLTQMLYNWKYQPFLLWPSLVWCSMLQTNGKIKWRPVKVTCCCLCLPIKWIKTLMFLLLGDQTTFSVSLLLETFDCDGGGAYPDMHAWRSKDDFQENSGCQAWPPGSLGNTSLPHQPWISYL